PRSCVCGSSRILSLQPGAPPELCPRARAATAGARLVLPGRPCRATRASRCDPEPRNRVFSPRFGDVTRVKTLPHQLPPEPALLHPEPALLHPEPALLRPEPALLHAEPALGRAEMPRCPPYVVVRRAPSVDSERCFQGASLNYSVGWTVGGPAREGGRRSQVTAQAVA